MYAILAQAYQFKAGSCAAEEDDWSKAEFYAKEARMGARVESTVEEQSELTTVPLTKSTTKPIDLLCCVFLCMLMAGMIMLHGEDRNKCWFNVLQRNCMIFMMKMISVGSLF